MCLDGAGNLYFQRVENISFNGGNHRSFSICKIAPNGVVTTVAGGGTTLPNDNVSLAATDVLFCIVALLLSTLPVICTSRYLRSQRTNGPRIRKVGLDGQITTIAGTGATFIEGAQALNVKLERDGGSDPNYEMCLDGAGNLYFQRVENIRINGATIGLGYLQDCSQWGSYHCCRWRYNLPNDNVSLAATDVLFLHRGILLSTLPVICTSTILTKPTNKTDPELGS